MQPHTRMENGDAGAERLPGERARSRSGTKILPAEGWLPALRGPFWRVSFIAATVFLLTGFHAGAAVREFFVDFGVTNGQFRALHGINKGPLAPGGIVDLTARHKELAPPLNRLHDCHWPNPDLVDIHAVFPNPSADPSRVESYDFRLTDEYLAAIAATGAKIVYRLGESIEHTSVKRFVHPPSDPGKWADICLGIVRHCNDGWAGGTHLGIQYWEIWNEPENRPVMWTGTDEQFLDMYARAAKALKRHDGALKVGGPSFGYCGQFVNGEFRPSPFATNFLAMCRRDGVPLDFFSWHCYTADPGDLVARARAIRALLDTFGFTRTESHLNEWNYLPRNSWTALSRKSSPEARQAAVEEMSGPGGAAFIATALIELQEAPVDACNFYHADTGAFGLFTEQGAATKNFYGLLALSRLAGAGTCVTAMGGEPSRMAIAAAMTKDRHEGRIVIANYAGDTSEFEVSIARPPGSRTSKAELRLVDASHGWEAMPLAVKDGRFHLELRAPAVALIVLR